MAALIPAELLEIVCKTCSTTLFYFLLLARTSSISVCNSWYVSAFPLSIALTTNNSFDGISSIVSFHLMLFLSSLVYTDLSAETVYVSAYKPVI